MLAAGLSAQSLSVSPGNVSFGPIAVGGKSAAKSVRLSNDGSVDVAFTGFSLGGTNPGDFTIASNDCPAKLAAGAKCKVDLVFSPVAAALRTGLLLIADDAPGSPQKVALTGTGTGTGNLNFYPSSLSFFPGVVGQPQNPTSLFIQNGNSIPATILSIAVSGRNSGDFPISSDDCPIAPLSLPPYGGCSLAIPFTPSAIGLRVATLVVSVAGQTAPTFFSLAAVGQTAKRALTFSPPVVVFVPTPLGAANFGALTVADSGNSPVHLNAVDLGGPDSPDFQLGGYGCSPPGTILPQSYCVAELTFQPKAQGIRLASLLFHDNATGNPQTVILFAQALAGTDLLTLYPDDSVFAPAGVGSSEIVGFEIRNEGTQPATVNQISITGANASDFNVSFASCGPLPLDLPPGGYCSADVTFTPSAIGGRIAELDVSSNLPGNQLSAALAGQGQPDLLRIEAAGAPVNFSATPVGGQSYNPLQFLNAGNVNVTFSPFALHGSDSGDFSIQSDGCSGMTGGLPPGQSCTLYIGFSPQATGIRAATLNSTENSGAGSENVLLVGSGSPAGDPLAINIDGQFSSAVGIATQPVTIYVTNESQTPVTLAGLSFAGGSASDFSIFENSCNAGRVLNSGTDCAVLIVFTPGAVGVRVAALQLSASSASGLVITTIPLVGKGLSQSKTLSIPSWQSFQSVPVGASSLLELEILNDGADPVQITSLTLGGRNSSDVTIFSSTCPSPGILPAGQTCYVTLKFTPSGTGPRIVGLRITDDAAGSPQFISLDSFGLSSQLLVSFSSDLFSFGAEVPGTTSQPAQVFLTNSGNAPANIGGFSIAGGEAGDFSFDASQCPSTLPVNGNCPLSLFFSPSKLGIRAAELLVNYGAPAGPASMFLTGDGVAATRTIGFSPLPVNFDDAVTGSTVTQTLQVDNLGTDSVTINGFKTTGANAAEFSVQSGTCTTGNAEVAPGQSCTVTLAFTPAANGQRQAILKIADNATGNPQSMPLAGLGISPSLTLEMNPSALLFGTTAVGSTAGPLNLIIDNSGNAPVSISNFAIAGVNALDFAIDINSCGSSLATGQYCSLFVTFTPSATGPRIAQLQVRDDATGSPQAVQLTGTGQ